MSYFSNVLLLLLLLLKPSDVLWEKHDPCSAATEKKTATLSPTRVFFQINFILSTRVHLRPFIYLCYTTSVGRDNGIVSPRRSCDLRHCFHHPNDAQVVPETNIFDEILLLPLTAQRAWCANSSKLQSRAEYYFMDQIVQCFSTGRLKPCRNDVDGSWLYKKVWKFERWH